MSSRTLVIVLLISIPFLMGSSDCGPGNDGVNGPSVLKDQTVLAEQNINFQSVTTIGNHSFIPIRINGNPAGHISEILGLLNAFEEKHPELEITAWKIERDQVAHSSGAFIFGIWIDHRPKK